MINYSEPMTPEDREETLEHLSEIFTEAHTASLDALLQYFAMHMPEEDRTQLARNMSRSDEYVHSLISGSDFCDVPNLVGMLNPAKGRRLASRLAIARLFMLEANNDDEVLDQMIEDVTDEKILSEEEIQERSDWFRLLPADMQAFALDTSVEDETSFARWRRKVHEWLIRPFRR